jgi:hypothetical protein
VAVCALEGELGISFHNSTLNLKLLAQKETTQDLLYSDFVRRPEATAGREGPVLLECRLEDSPCKCNRDLAPLTPDRRWAQTSIEMEPVAEGCSR